MQVQNYLQYQFAFVINPIENVFNLVEREFQHQAIQNGITYETYQQFAEIV